MKLYTRQHVILTAVISAAAVFIITTVLFLRIYLQTPSSEKETVAKNETSVSNVTETFYKEEIDSAAAFTNGGSTDSNSVTNVVLTDSQVTYTQDELQNIDVYERCNEAVVNINTQVMAVNWFLEPVPQNGGSGSGSIIDARGYVVTNVHVIENAYKIYISLSDGTQYEGKVVGTDSASDIAVIKFDPPAGMELKTIPFGNSSQLKVGQKVLAIGNPFGFERTLTSGIVSGLGRPIRNSANTIIRDMIQTDTAINPGNSGGPLLDTQGRMIGINTMIYSTSGSSAGIGFAVPINTAKRVVSDLIQYGKVHRGTIDGKFVQLTSSIAKYANLSVNRGLLVSELSKSSNAYSAGLKAGTEAVQYGSRYNSTTIYLGGDVIIAVDGTDVTSFADYYSLLESKKPGDKADLTVQRGRQKLTISVVLDGEK